MDTRYNAFGYASIFGLAQDAAKSSGLPGEHNGPADAFRHIVASAEAARRYGEFPASLFGQLNEVKGDIKDSQPEDERRMDLANNAIGIRIGLSAGSFEEIIERAKAEISGAEAHGGDGTDGTAQWLPQERWSKEMPPSAPAEPSSATESRAPTAERVLARPVEDWTQDDVRAVQDSKIYRRGDGPERSAAFGKVRRWYEAKVAREAQPRQPHGGPVAVSAYMRSDGTQVASHSRGAPR